MCVIGAGAIGSLFAAHLARVAPVAVLTRREEQARSLRERGLRVSGRSDFTVQVLASSTPEELPEFGLCIVATKATSVAQAARSLAGRSPYATMVTIQNGLGAEELVSAHGDWAIVSGTTLMGGARRTDNHVEYELDAPTWLGPHGGTPYRRVEEIASLIVRSGLKAQAFPDIRPAQWSKLVFNAAVGTVSAVTGLPHSQRYADESGLGSLVGDLIAEGKRVAAAAGVELHEDPWELNVRAVEHNASYAHPPSILVDVQTRQPTEVDFNIGAIVREAQRLGVPAPLSAALYGLLKAKEASYS